MTVEQVKALNNTQRLALENKLDKARDKFYAKAEKKADDNHEINGVWYEDWAEEEAVKSIFGSLEAYDVIYEHEGMD